jgi:hypothetical protein
MTPFNQVCVWASTIVGTDNVESFEKFMLDEYKVRVKYMEEIKTAPDMDNGKIVKGTGDRNDVFFKIHTDDIPKFAVKRLSMDPPVRWIEDVLDNQRGQMLYPDRIQEMRTW